MQCQFIKTCTALSVVGMAGTAFAGGADRFDASFAAAEIFNGDVAGNVQNLDTASGGRYYGSFGHSNLDIDICWNTGATYSGWASEVQFVMEMEDGTTAGAGALFLLAPAPFAGDDTGSDVEGQCSNRVLADEIDNPFTAFTFQVPDDGLVDVAIASSWGDDTGLPHSIANTANFYFTLGEDIPAGCVDATGSCAEANGTPGCEDLSCCAINCDVNQGGDPFCCDSSWDSTCAETAIALCGIFEYSCDSPAGANDCATSPTMVNAGDVVAFDTTGFNTDGPAQPECGSGAGFEQLDSDAWYMIEVAAEGILTASTCNDASFDTKIAIYNAGAIGSTFDPANLENAFVLCDEDGTDDAGAACADFTSFARADVEAGNQYLIRVGGYGLESGTGNLSVDVVGRIAPQECTAGNADSFSQVNPASGDFVDANIVSCNGPTYSAQNGFARIYSAADMGADVFNVDCVKVPMLQTCEYTGGIIRMLKSASGSAAPYADLEVIAESNVGLYQNGLNADETAFVPEIQIANFGGVEVDLSDGSSLVIEVVLPGNADCYTIPSGGTLADISDGTSTTYLRSSSCGITEYTSMAAVGGFDSEMFQFVEGSAGGGGTPCPTDFNNDGITDGADFGTILASWGTCPAPCPADLDGNGEVNGADVGSILAAWGACAP